MSCCSKVCHPHPPTLTHLVCQPCHTNAVVAAGRGEARHVSAVVRPARTRALTFVCDNHMDRNPLSGHSGGKAADIKAAV